VDLCLQKKLLNMVSNRLGLILIVLLFSQFFRDISAQENDSYYFFVTFEEKEKNNEINNPLSFLSQKSMDRRAKSSLAITTEDIPISKKWIESISQIANTHFHYALKWQNGIVVSSPDISVKDNYLAFDFVKLVKIIKKPTTASRRSVPLTIINQYNYGLASQQTELINIPILHEFGFRGKGITMAIFDNGFKHVDTFPLFSHLWNEKRILGQFDIVEGDDNAIPHGGHGMAVLSTIAALSKDTMTGTAPEASFYLFRTEDNASETELEEYNWARAAEIADSVGVDIINSSLGYSLFDDSTTSHTYADLDGKTTVVTRAANAAFRKGILVINSAGNSGTRPWRYIIAPADGMYVLAIGATDSIGNIAAFSSRGPNAAGQLKPNVSALGAGVVVGDGAGAAGKSNGTSFSAPTIAGAAACLVQAFPKASNNAVFRAIEASSDRYNNPDFDYGNGIPDFQKAYEILAEKYLPQQFDQKLIRNFLFYPNPANDFIYLEFIELQSTPISVSVFNYSGIELLSQDFGFQIGNVSVRVNNLKLSAGIYVIELTRGDYLQRKIFVTY
jgi:serine protease AprX